jgi:S-adenosylmethionine decarboxylase proenzyme
VSLPRTEPTATAAFAGVHVLAQLEGVARELLDDVDHLRFCLERALLRAGATVCEVVAKRFAPQGVTVLALLSESHASVHTYPELGSAFLDVFTCGTSADPELAVRLLAEDLGADPAACQLTTIRRGRDGGAG